MIEHQARCLMKRILEKVTGLSRLRESGHKPDWKEVEIIAKENKIVKGKFKWKALHLPGKTKTIF